MLSIQDLPVYAGKNYAPVEPLIRLKEGADKKVAPTKLTQQLKERFEELDSRDAATFENIAETAYVISSFMQGRQLWQKNYYGVAGGRWELVAGTPKGDPNKVRSINKMQFQISQMLEDLVSSSPDFEPEDMFKSHKHEKQVRASKAVWNYYEKKFYTPQFNIEQGLSLITSGTGLEELVYDASSKSVKVFKEIWGEVPMVTDPGRGECLICGHMDAPEGFHQWDSIGSKQEFGEIQQAARSGDAEGQEWMQKNPLAAMAQCPNCGGFDVDLLFGEIENVPSVIGLEQYDLGDFRLHNLPIQAVRYDPAVRPEDSSYFIDKRFFSKRKLKRIFGDLNIELGTFNDNALDYLHRMPRMPAGVGGARGEFGLATKPQENTILVRMSLSPDELADIEIPSDSESQLTISGGKLPEGATLADLCPEGATVFGFGKMEHIYGIFQHYHSKSVSSMFYFSRPLSGTGRGAEDLAEIQKRVNKIDAQQVKAVDGAAPGYAFVEGAADEKHIAQIGFPNARIPIRRELFNQTGKISDYIQQFAPQQVAPQFFAYAVELDKMMQMTSHVVSMSGAVYGADNRTATGARILEGTAQAIAIPILQSKAGGRQGTIRNLLCSYKQVFQDIRRQFPMIGKGRSKSFDEIEVTGGDIDPQIEFVIVENSVIPQNYYVRKADYLAFAQTITQLGGFAEVKAADPKLLSTLAKVFGVDIGADDYDHIEDICRMRLMEALELGNVMAGIIEEQMAMQAQMQQAAAMQPAPAMPQPGSALTQPEPSATMPPMDGVAGAPSTVQPSPEQASTFLFDMLFDQLSVPITPVEKDHLLKVEWFRTFLDTHEGLKLSRTDREIVAELVLKHQEMDRVYLAMTQAQNDLAMGAAQLPNQMMQMKLSQMAGMVPMPAGGEGTEGKSKPPA